MPNKICKNYISKKQLVKLNQYKVMLSYTSMIEDLNKVKQSSLINHFHTIEKAIKFAKKQYEEGILEKFHTPLPELADSYKHRVYCAAKRISDLEKHGCSMEDAYLTSQPFWIDWTNIIKYDIREDKSLDSKFQVFVEFTHANKNEKPLKLNARMTEQAYKHKDELYKDGFDLVRYSKHTFGIRHISQLLVERRDTNSTKLLYIDRYANIFEVFRNCIGEDNEVFAQCYTSRDKNKKLLKLARQTRRKLTKKAYIDKLHRIRVYLKRYFNDMLENNDYDKVVTLKPTYHHKFANHLVQIWTEELKQACLLHGAKCKIIEKTDTEMDSIIKNAKISIRKNAKEKAKQWNDPSQCLYGSIETSHKVKTRFTKHTKWSDYSIVLLNSEYNSDKLYMLKDRSIEELQKYRESRNVEIVKSQTIEQVDTSDNYDEYYEEPVIQDEIVWI